MTEDEKKEFEEFLQWKKEQQKQTNEKEGSQQPEEHDKQIYGAEDNANTSKEPHCQREKNRPDWRIFAFTFVVIIAIMALIVAGLINNIEKQPEANRESLVVDTLQAKNDSIQKAREDSIEKAQRIELLKHSVRITKARLSSPNSVGGVDAIVYYKNLSKKTIKYFYWHGCAMNAVGDIVGSEIGGREFFGGKDTGPIKSEKTGGGHWECVIYNSTAKRLIITEVVIEYMDGTELKIGEDEIKYIK